MLYRNRVLAILEIDLQIVTSSILSLDKHAITPEKLKENLERIKDDLENLSSLVNRESEKKYTLKQLQ